MKCVQLCWIVHNEAQTDAGAGISQVTEWWSCHSGLGLWDSPESCFRVSHM